VTRSEVRGRRITLAIAAYMALPVPLRFLLLTFSRRPVPAGAWTNEMFAAVIVVIACGLLCTAYEWARFCIGWLWLVSGAMSAARLVWIAKDFSTMMQFRAWALLLVPRLVPVALAAALLWSPSVRAYFDRENLGALRVPDQEALV
jgi:hypothetical protein